jgi:hypothetical protein
VGSISAKTIIYTDMGLRFAFNNDGKRFMTVYLLDYAEGPGRIYAAYKGKLSKGLNSDWKIKRFLEEFTEFKLDEETGYETGLHYGYFAGPKCFLIIELNAIAQFMSKLTVLDHKS